MAKSIKEMSEELGIKKENFEAGLKQDKEHMEDAIKKAHDFMKGKRNK